MSEVQVSAIGIILALVTWLLLDIKHRLQRMKPVYAWTLLRKPLATLERRAHALPEPNDPRVFDVNEMDPHVFVFVRMSDLARERMIADKSQMLWWFGIGALALAWLYVWLIVSHDLDIFLILITLYAFAAVGWRRTSLAITAWMLDL